MSVDFPDDPRAPVFFLSYARPRRVNVPVARPRYEDRRVERLFKDLTDMVNELVPLPAGRDPGFMDRQLAGGELWEEELLRAVGTCQVFICLISPRYLNDSEWCAMEWDVFSRRKRVRRADGSPGGNETSIVPVLWAPVVDKIPDDVNAVTRFSPRDMPDPAYEAAYEENGLFGLLTQHQTDAYEAFVWKLALHVQRLNARYYVEPKVPRNTTGLRKSFGGETR